MSDAKGEQRERVITLLAQSKMMTDDTPAGAVRATAGDVLQLFQSELQAMVDEVIGSLPIDDYYKVNGDEYFKVADVRKAQTEQRTRSKEIVTNKIRSMQ